MTIISTKPQLMQFFSDTFLEKTARRCGFIERLRNIGPQSLVLSQGESVNVHCLTIEHNPAINTLSI